ncbi:MAG: hypothetical protein HY645_10255 [Acidobacteria bacterium]|nr:hypothetical protein [Acidobacteriota bacterium]
MLKSCALWLVLILSFASVPAQVVNDAAVPPPLRIHVPFEAAWTRILELLRDQRKLPLATVDRANGKIITRFFDYNSGPLTGSHIAKIGHKPELIEAEWVRVQYQVEILLEIVQANELLLTVDANVRALKRPFIGEETWVDIPSNGQLEEELLTEFGRMVFGQNFSLKEPKKGFWQREPAYVPEMQERRRPVVGPERVP